LGDRLFERGAALGRRVLRGARRDEAPPFLWVARLELAAPLRAGRDPTLAGPRSASTALK